MARFISNAPVGELLLEAVRRRTGTGTPFRCYICALMNRNSRSASRRPVAVAAAALYFVAQASAPLAHAEAELFGAGGAVETEHSSSCPILHADALCSAGTATPLASAATLDKRVTPDVVEGVPTSSPFAAPKNPDRGPRRVRAPPTG